jgi:hypothetical protein
VLLKCLVPIGDLVPIDEHWEVFLLLRQLVLYTCGLSFTASELKFMQSLVEEFLSRYVTVFNIHLTLKFHNLTHYATVISNLGPLYNMWVMRCEAKHRDSKLIALCSGNFKNICKTIATRQQMRLSERLMANRGFEDDTFSVTKCAAVTLCQLKRGQTISSLLGNYGLFRELFQATKISVHSIDYRVGDVILYGVEEGLWPVLMQIEFILILGSHEANLVGRKLLIVEESHHFQAYVVEISDVYLNVPASSMESCSSPWPLHFRACADHSYVSLIHKIWIVIFYTLYIQICGI